MSQLDQSLLIFFIVYVLVVIGIALYRTNRAQEMADHVLAGRRVGAIATGLSASSSLDRGSSLFVFTAIAFVNPNAAVMVAFAMIVGLWASWKLIGPRLRRCTFAAQNALTVPEFLERRFDDRTGILRVLAALLTLLFVLFYVSAGVMIGGILFNLAFDISVAVGGIITILAVLAYIFIGGYLVVARTDVFQSIVTLLGLVLLAVAVYVVADNPLEGIGEDFGPGADIPEGTSTLILVLIAPFIFGMFQGAFGAQRLLQRFMAAKSEAIMDTSRRISVVWLIIAFGFAILIGLFARYGLPQEGFRFAPFNDTGAPAPEVGMEFFYWVTVLIESPVLGALALTAVAAAVMSTIDSQMLIGASVAASDLPFVRKYAQRKRFEFVLGAYMRVWIGRLMLILIGLIAWLLAMSQPNSIVIFLVYAWLGLGATFGPVVLLSLYWRRFNLYGAMAGLIAGGLITLVGLFLGVDIVTFGALTVCVLPIAVLVTLVTKAPSAAVQESFDQSIVKTETA